jgi:hypothetical protein
LSFDRCVKANAGSTKNHHGECAFVELGDKVRA